MIEMKKWHKISIVVLLFFIFINIIRFVWINEVQPTISTITQTTPGEIILDESNIDLITLDGQWSFYPNELLTVNQLNDKGLNEKSKNLAYPKDWNHLSASKGFTYGTFHIRVHLNEQLSEQSLSVIVPNPILASRLFVDNKEVGASGNPADNEDSFKASISPFTASFIPNGEEIHLILHVANNGLTPYISSAPVLFGTTEAINEQIFITKFSKIFFITVLILLVLIAFYLSFRLNLQKSLFYFSIVLLIFSLIVLLDYDQILLLDLPFDYSIISKINRLLYILVSLFLFQFFKSFFSNNKVFKRYRFYPYFNILYALFVVIMPIQLVFQIPGILSLILIIPAINFLHLLYLEKSKTDHIFLLFMMAIALINNIIWAIIKGNVKEIHFDFYPIDLLLAITLFILYWVEIHLKNTRENERLKNELIEKDKSKDEFLAVTSHELRNPLHSMINIAQLVKNNPKNTIQREDKNDLELLQSVGKRMSLLINDLLDLTLINENKLRLAKQSIRLHYLVDVSIDMLSYLFVSKKVIIHNEVSENFPPVYADENRVIQVLLNLLHNAIKFSDESDVFVRAFVKDEMAIVQVVDSGKGIDIAIVEEIFDPYSKSTSHDGIGLGLKITKDLIEKHGGEITVTSKVNEGSTFTFSLPLSSEEAATIIQNVDDLVPTTELGNEVIHFTENPPSDSDKTDAPKILLVDDDPVNLKVISNILSEKDYRVYLASNGEEALKEINRMTFDLVITDIMMPVMTGYELIREIRKRYDLSELPIIALTARGRIEDLSVGFQLGANDYVIKPVDAFELTARVQVLTELQTTIKNQLKLEAAWLRAQINPHFLLNTLTSIMMLSRKDIDEMNYLLNKFIIYLKTSFDFNYKTNLVLLKDELQLVDAYLTIEQERFGDRIQIQWEIDESLSIYIPPLILQTLVENAINHGILKKPAGGTITLHSYESEEEVIITIKDDGVGMSEETVKQIQQPSSIHHGGIGIINTNKRLQKWLGTKLKIESELNIGTKFKIHINKSQTNKEIND